MRDLVEYNLELGQHNYFQGGKFLPEYLHYEVEDTPLILQVQDDELLELDGVLDGELGL